MPTAITPNPEPADVRQWIDKAKDNNLMVLSQQASLHSAGYTVSKSRAGHLWTLDFVASTGTNYSSGSTTFPTPYESRVKSNVAGVQFAMPIFEGGLSSSHIREAIANRDKLASQLEETRRKAGADARQSYADVTNGIAQSEALQASVEAGEAGVKGNQSGYKLGIRINSDVLNAQQQLFTAKRDWVKARYDTLLAGLKLKAAAGVLTEADVMGINGLLGR
ncbi:MAG: TolC family protein [Gallionella sp.]